MGVQSFDMDRKLHGDNEVTDADLGGHSNGAPTTLMFRYMPRKFTSAELLEEATKFVDVATIDFVYVPWNKSSKNNLGYGFLNLTTPPAAAHLLIAMQGALWSHDVRERSIVVVPARVQGLENNIARFLERFRRQSDCDCDMDMNSHNNNSHNNNNNTSNSNRNSNNKSNSSGCEDSCSRPFYYERSCSGSCDTSSDDNNSNNNKKHNKNNSGNSGNACNRGGCNCNSCTGKGCHEKLLISSEREKKPEMHSILHQPQVLQNGRPIDFQSVIFGNLNTTATSTTATTTPTPTCCNFPRQASFDSASSCPTRKDTSDSSSCVARSPCKVEHYPGKNHQGSVTSNGGGGTLQPMPACVSPMNMTMPTAIDPLPLFGQVHDLAGRQPESAWSSTNNRPDIGATSPSLSGVATVARPCEVYESRSRSRWPREEAASPDSPESWRSCDFSEWGHPLQPLPLPLYLVWNCSGGGGITTSHSKNPEPPTNFKPSTSLSIQRAAYSASASASVMRPTVTRWRF